MDGENNGKPYLKWMIWGVPLFFGYFYFLSTFVNGMTFSIHEPTSIPWNDLPIWHLDPNVSNTNWLLWHDVSYTFGLTYM